MPIQVSKQATIVFQPLSIQTSFEKQFGIQIAFYRSTLINIQQLDDKVKKIDPIKIYQPQKRVLFNSKESLMKLHTTLNYFQDENIVQNKVFKLQIIYKIDGNKNSIQKDVNVSQYFNKSKENFIMHILNKPLTQLKYRVQIYFKDQVQKNRNQVVMQHNKRQNQNDLNKNQAKSIGPVHGFALKSIPKPILTNKSLKFIRFQDNQQKSQVQKENKSKQRQRKRYDTVKIADQFKGINNIDQNNNEKVLLQNKKLQLKIYSLQKHFNQKAKQLSTLKSTYTQLQQKHKQCNIKYQHLNDKFLQHSTQKPSSKGTTPSSVKQNNLQAQTTQKLQKLQKQHNTLKDIHSQNQKQLQAKECEIKRLNSQVRTLNEQLRKNGVSIKSLKDQNRQLLQPLVQNKKQSSAGKSLEESLKPYKERIKMLQRQNQNLQQEKKYAEKQYNNSSQEGYQAKQKIKTLNQQALRQLEDGAAKQYQLEKLSKKVNDLEIELRNTLKDIPNTQLGSDDQHQPQNQNQLNVNMFKSQRVIDGSGTSLTKLKAENSQLKTKLTITQKNLQNKQNLLRKFESISKEDRKQLEEDIDRLKKQNSSLKQKLSSLQNTGPSGTNSQISQLEFRMELEKVKKQLEYKIKSQRQLLIEKSHLQTRSKTLQQDVVKSKQSIANILNVIHQFGDEGLIEDVNQFLG